MAYHSARDARRGCSVRDNCPQGGGEENRDEKGQDNMFRELDEWYLKQPLDHDLRTIKERRASNS